MPQRPPPRLAPNSRRALALLIGLCVLIELALQGADLHLWASPWSRNLAYAYGAFWPELMRGGHVLYGGQRLVMFVTHPFLHAGLSHLAGNMLTLALLGTALLRQMRLQSFLWLYGLSAVAGALAYSALGNSGAPMVGASGAISGLVGALVMRQLIPLTAFGLRQLLGFVAIFALANALMYLNQGGMLAWQAHLGGLLAGIAFALVVKDRPHPRS